MGLINWFKDKVILRIEHDLAMTNTRIEGLELQLDQVRTQLASVRALAIRGKHKRSEEEADEENPASLAHLPKDVRDFYASTIEFQQAEKYKNLKSQEE